MLSAGELLQHLYWPEMLNHFAEDVEWHLPIGLGEPLGGRHQGRAAVTHMLNFVFTEFYVPETVAPEIKAFVTGDDHATMLFTMIASTPWGQPYRNEYCITIQAANGQITRVYEYLDTKHLLDIMDNDRLALAATRFGSPLPAG